MDYSDFRTNKSLIICGKQIPISSVRASRAKNAATILMAPSLLTEARAILLTTYYKETKMNNSQHSWSKILIMFVFVSFFVFIKESAFAGNYHVSVSGSDYNSGTDLNPLLTLQKALTLAMPGDVILLKDGTYVIDNKLEIQISNITIKAYPGNKPTIQYTGTDTYFIVTSFKAEQVFLDGLTICWASPADGNIITLVGQYATIRNCEIYFNSTYSRSKYDCIKILRTANNATIEDCHIYGAPNQGIDTVGANNLTIRNNVIHDCQNAIVLKGGSMNNIVEKNSCYNLKRGAIGIGGYTDAQWIKHDVGYENVNTTVRRNIIWYDYANNIGGAIFLMGAKDAKVFNNTIYGAGIHILSGGDPTKPAFNCNNIQIYNNIIWTRGNDGVLKVDTDNDSGLDIRNNCYWSTGPVGLFMIKNVWYNKYADYIKQSFIFEKISFFQNPIFKNASLHDFALSLGSPAIDHGLPITGETYSGKCIDIGAIEFLNVDEPAPVQGVKLRQK